MQSVEAFSVGPVATLARPFRHRGRLLLSVVVKGTYALRQDAEMTAITPAPIVTVEQHHGDLESASLRRATDVALVVARPEIALAASAFAPRGAEVERITVRLALARGNRLLLDKRLEVIGDRRAKPGGADVAGRPFRRMPIVYERAFGGPGHADNPLGCGMQPDGRGDVVLPNVMYPPGATQAVAPAGLGPLSSGWQQRARHLGGLSRGEVDAEGPVTLPEGFDEAFFQAAPADQWVEAIEGGELLAMQHMHPEHETIRTSLPRQRGVGMVQTRAGDRRPIHLRIDTLFVEPDAMRAEIVSRGTMELDEADLEGLRVAGAIEDPSDPIEWPDLTTLKAPTKRRAPAAQPTAVLPLPGGAPLGGTMIIQSDEPAPARGRGLGVPDSPHASTMLVDPGGEAAPASLPFAGRQRGARRTPTPAGALPGAPWAAEKAPETPAPKVPAGGLDSTMVIETAPPPTVALKGPDYAIDDEPTAVAPPKAVAAPPAVEPPAPTEKAPEVAKPEAAKPASVQAKPEPDARPEIVDEPSVPEVVVAERYRQDPPAQREPAPEPTPASQPKPARPKPGFQTDLYKRFKR